MSEFEEYIKTIMHRRFEKGEDPEGRCCGNCVYYSTCKIIVDVYANACGNFKSKEF